MITPAAAAAALPCTLVTRSDCAGQQSHDDYAGEVDGGVMGVIRVRILYTVMPVAEGMPCELHRCWKLDKYLETTERDELHSK